MKVPGKSRDISGSFVTIFERLPVLSSYAKTRGWPYVLGWLHRLSGTGLIVILTVHLYALLSLQAPDVLCAGIRSVVAPACLFPAWASSLVVGFHALNGGRLILYEIFGMRDDAVMIRRTFGLTALYAAIAGLMLIMKNQHLSGFLYWMATSVFGAVAAYAVASRIWETRHSLLWKLQRISGAFLFIAVPAYLLFAYLNPGEVAGVRGVITWMQDLFTKLAALTLAAAVLYHAGYGLFSIAADYAPARRKRVGITAIIVVVIAALAVFAFGLVLTA
jgi:succinate dehydrogenase hydrophobic anchor subunit